MAQLKDTVVTGSLHTTDTTYTTTLQTQILKIPDTSNGSTYTTGANNSVPMSNGTSLYWKDMGVVLGGVVQFSMIAPNYSDSSTYSINDLVIKDALLYRCTTNISTAETWNSSHWTQTTVAAEILALRALANRAAFLTNS